jgi:EAL domain-containing protein (putative c-di-GMP-specific phosphodiesterase class I)
MRQVLYRLICVKHLGELAAAYGVALVQSLEREGRRRLMHLDVPEAEDVAVDVFDGLFYLRAAFNDGDDVDEHFFDELILLTMSSRPFVMDGHVVIADVAIERVEPYVAGRSSPWAAVRQSKLPCSPPWLDCLEHMTTAVDVYQALLDNRVALVAQPVQSPDGQRVLYHECLARILAGEGDGRVIVPDAFIPALEGMRLTRHFDRFVMRKTIDLLRQDPSITLGCNVSALSTVDDAWWSSTFAFLAMAPNIASRLVVELTETAESADIHQTVRFCERLRSLGCRIAVDDFGTGYSSIGFVLAVKPDILKVDMRVMQLMRGSPDASLPRHLMNLLGRLAHEVVIERVETEADFLAARGEGFRWLQGKYLPSMKSGAMNGGIQARDMSSLVDRLCSIEAMALTASTPKEALCEYIHFAQRVVDSPESGLRVGEADAVVSCYCDMLYRSLCGLPDSLGKPRVLKFPRKVCLSEEMKRAVEAIGVRHGAALRAQWKRAPVRTLQ